MKWRPGLRESIAFTVVLMTVAATVAMGFVAYEIQAGSARHRFVESARAGILADAQQAYDRTRDSRDPASSKVDEVAKFMTGRIGLTWAVVNLHGTAGPVSPAEGGQYVAVASTNSRAFGQDLPVAVIDSVRGTQAVITYTPDTPDSPQLAVVREISTDLVLAEFYDLRPLEDELSLLRKRLALVGTGVAAVAALLGVLAARGIQRPVRAAADAAQRFGAGELGTRVPVRGNDELAGLAGAFNAMAQRLGESIDQLRMKEQQQRRFVADVAHDLRTPLASMIAATESLHSTDAGDRERSAELLGTQVRRLSRLVEDLLEMSRFDAGAADFRPETVDLEALAHDAIALSAPDLEIPVRVSGDAVITGDPRRLHTIVRNLVTNAVRHGAPPVVVTVDGTAPGHARVLVADSGPGLPPDLAPFVFDRFVRGDRARGETEGSGLGLAIAHENAVLHGGRLEVTGPPGTVFVLTVPRGTPPDEV
ncbi:sensor histidine kinase [Amycolatopsis sp. NPDC059021]|uniref:sensor histidine kinase n=1 Tax=Amycolatopsis sp. NPDC059021 TaxID=3346704 RepID=UPI00366BE24D